MKIWSCLIAGIGMLGMFDGAGMDLVKDGKACSEIVVADDAPASVMLAARDLQQHLEKMSGGKFRIVSPRKIRAENLICVGESEVTRQAGYQMPAFKGSGYDIMVKGKLAVLNGPVTAFREPRSVYADSLHPQSRLFSLQADSAFGEEDCGPMHAVCAFLEYLGVRFYAPYEDGTVIPDRETISVPDLRETKSAAFARRVYLYGKARTLDSAGAMWFRRLKSGSSLKTAGMLPLAAVLKQNVKDEWHARLNNDYVLLTNDGCTFPRFFDPSFQQACVEFVRAALDADPDTKQLELVLPSLRGDNDYRDLKTVLTRTIYPQPASCDLMTLFFSAVAGKVKKTHPDRILICQNRYMNIPSEVSRNGIPDTLKFHPCSLAAVQYAQPAFQNKYFKLIADMNKLCKSPMQQREWWNEFSHPETPRQGMWFMHALQQVRREQRQFISGIAADPAIDPENNRLAAVPLTHLMYYVNSKLLWDPDLDLDALLDEYYRLWFGPAAPEMKAFFIFAESLSSRPEPRLISMMNGQLRKTDLQFASELLAKAKGKTVSGSVFRRRIEDLENSLAPLKQFFAQRVPAGDRLEGKILPVTARCDGDFSKYSVWTAIPGHDKNSRTEFSLAVTENRSCLFIALRCYEPEMSKLKKAGFNPDDPEIFNSDHVMVRFDTPLKAGFLVAVNPWGSFADGCADPDEIMRNGCFLGWSKPMTRAWAKRYDDRWEAELMVQLQGCGKLPDFGDPWGIDLTRVRGRERFSLTPGAERRMQLRRQLVIPKVDSKNDPVSFFYQLSELIPGYPDESVYIVKRAAGPVDLAAAWDSKVWKDIPEMRLGWLLRLGPDSGFYPDARAKIQYDDRNLYVLYQVRDRYVRAMFKKDQSMVCLDSCMEFFVQPDKNGPYYNFECNCIGTLLLYEVTSRNRQLKMSPLPLEELSQVKRFSSLPRDLSGEIEKTVTWRLGLQIPLSLFIQRAGVQLPLRGQVWFGNVYKCADWSSHPCWLMWKRNDTFHCPEGFGALIFE